MSAYLDYNATAPVRPEARAAVVDALNLVGNASSVHKAGRQARALLEASREKVAALIGWPNDRVIFTSGGTEANYLALNGITKALRFVSAIEHPSVLNAALDATKVDVDLCGVIKLDHLSDLLTQARAASPEGARMLVSIMLANNETGVVQPMAEISAICRSFGALLHCDAVQGAGKLDLRSLADQVDLLSLSSHKIGGPQGVGALLVRDGLEIEPLQRGGGQERSRRGGTENLPGIAGFGAACKVVMENLEDEQKRLQNLRDKIEQEVANQGIPAYIIATDVPRLSNTTCLALPGFSAETQVMGLDLAGVMVSAGSACSSGKVRSSHVLGAMGLGEDIASSAIRVSLGWQTTDQDIEKFIAAYQKISRRAQKKPTPLASSAA